MTPEQLEDGDRITFRLRVKEIVEDVLRDRKLTVEEAHKIEDAIRNTFEIVIAKKIAQYNAKHVGDWHKGWEIRGWGSLLKIASLIAMAVAVIEGLIHLLRG